MPTFTSVAFDRFLEPGASNYMAPPATNPPISKIERRHSTPNPSQHREIDAPNRNSGRGVPIPHNSKYDKRINGSSSTSVSVGNKHHRTQISPALYATPEPTPLPDSPSSFPPSPYIVNHKRRGPRLMKSFSEYDVATWEREADEGKVSENGNTDEKEVTERASEDDGFVSKKVPDVFRVDDATVPSVARENHLNGTGIDEKGNLDAENGPEGQNGMMKSVVGFDLQQDGEDDDFADPQDSMSVRSVGESECIGGAERSLNLSTPLAEFYDAWEELSSESGPQLKIPDIESELREIRLSLLMEIEKRKQAEETLCNMRNQWQKIHEKLSLLGLTLPEDLTTCLLEGEQHVDPAEEIWQQVYIARFVANSIGKGIAKAEAEMEMKAQIKLKNFEIARLWDRLRYYEAVNQEMSQRNQEVVEETRRLRQIRKRRQKWIWGSIATAVTLGSAVFAYSYFHSGKTSETPLHTTVSHYCDTE
ncbi:hypothetical protein STAS_26668 [Striga asiatica]|uniref:Netrin receptor DCC n=1 Tax=Striga asiatica TaxID=4170 RepID=A0A5A7QVP1_STRAF|nr:hypothetical protein STAS_26668 [Striga asiatica]